MEILEAHDLTKSFRTAAVVAGCSHHAAADHVAARNAGKPMAKQVARDNVPMSICPRSRNSYKSRGIKSGQISPVTSMSVV